MEGLTDLHISNPRHPLKSDSNNRFLSHSHIFKMTSPSKGPGFSLHVTAYINPADVPRFFELYKPVYEAVIAEPECRFFEVYQSPDEPGTIRWVENW